MYICVLIVGVVGCSLPTATDTGVSGSTLGITDEAFEDPATTRYQLSAYLCWVLTCWFRDEGWHLLLFKRNLLLPCPVTETDTSKLKALYSILCWSIERWIVKKLWNDPFNLPNSCKRNSIVVIQLLNFESSTFNVLQATGEGTDAK